jgi:hypothetical protein
MPRIPVNDAGMSADSLTLGLGPNGGINDYLLSTNGPGPSTDSKRKLEPPEVLGRLLEQGPAPSIGFLED